MGNFRWGIIAAIVALFFSVVLGIIGGVAAIHIFLRALLFSVIFFGLGFGCRFVVNSFFPELLFSSGDETVSETEDRPEENVTVVMDSTGEYAVPELYNIPSGSQELGNIEDLIAGIFTPRGSNGAAAGEQQSDMSFGIPNPTAGGAGGIDLNNEAGYNGFGAARDSFQPTFTAPDTSVFEKPEEEQVVHQQQFTPSFGDDSDSGLGGLPDLDMMAMAFSSFTGGVPAGPSSAPPAPSMPPPVSAEVEELEPDRRGYNTGNKPQTLQGDFDPKSLAEGIRTVLSKE
ncbi:MAG: hypothetical protein FWB95_06970 [Treponema sp.]|nr:hypothetical protein [Treponema sp.]